MKRHIAAAALAATLIPAAADALSVGMVRVGAPVRITAGDGAASDAFGISVGVSGSTAIVGAQADDDKGPESGSGYLLDINNGTQTKLTASDGAQGDIFGNAVGISGNTAIVGAAFDDDQGISSGSAYLVDISNGTQTKLTAGDGAERDLFGVSVGISGSTAIVGALFDDDRGRDSGSAYLFDTATGAQTQKLIASDGAAFDYFGVSVGVSVGISGGAAIVGAYGDNDNGSESGSAYLFDTATGAQTRKLTASDGAAFDYFGYSVGISGGAAIVGAYGDDDKGDRSGAAYLFDTTTGAQTRKLTASDGAAFDFFGLSVAIDDRFALVGAYSGVSNRPGAAYLFDVVTGTELLKIVAPDATNSQFGRSVALFGDLLLIGDPFFTNADGVQTGAAYLYQIEVVPLPAGAWLLLSGLGGFALLRRRAARAA